MKPPNEDPKQDPGYFGLGLPAFLGICGIAIGSYTYVHGSLFAYSHGLIDSAALILFFVFMLWLLGPLRRSSVVGTDAHENARNGFSFRLGKSLNRIRRGFRRSA